MAYMTKEGYDRLRNEIKQLESVERPKISAAIAEARDKGDLSENAEYDAAKEAQGMLELKIGQLKATLMEASIIDESQLSTDCVQILTTVKFKNLNINKVMEYTLVSESEANLAQGKLAISTPIAKGLLGKKVGEVVDVTIPQGTIKLEVLDISIK